MIAEQRHKQPPTSLSLDDQTIEWMMQDCDGVEIEYSETATVRDIEIGEPQHLEFGICYTEIIGTCDWSADPGGEYRVSKSLRSLGGRLWDLQGLETFSDVPWVLGGYAADDDGWES